MNPERQVKITFEVHSYGEGIFSIPGRRAPGYRVYVDGDLITERSFIWSDKDIYIKETAFVNLASGRHYLKLDSIDDPSRLLYFGNIKINGKQSDFEFTT